MTTGDNYDPFVWWYWVVLGLILKDMPKKYFKHVFFLEIFL